MDDPNWMHEAKCREWVHRRSTGQGVEWFSLDGRVAARICREECPVRTACAEHLLKLLASPETYPRDGVWAGVSYAKDRA